jgi:hypothetical protein
VREQVTYGLLGNALWYWHCHTHYLVRRIRSCQRHKARKDIGIYLSCEPASRTGAYSRAQKLDVPAWRVVLHRAARLPGCPLGQPCTEARTPDSPLTL